MTNQHERFLKLYAREWDLMEGWEELQEEFAYTRAVRILEQPFGDLDFEDFRVQCEGEDSERCWLREGGYDYFRYFNEPQGQYFFPVPEPEDQDPDFEIM